jgi:RNA polymerase sigma-70 factor (ECF subfamily)
VDQRHANWQNRVHFFAVASQVMRHILVDYARSHNAAKRGGDYVRISLEDAMIVSKEKSGDLMVLDEALNKLETIDPQQSRVVEMRVFGGRLSRRPRRLSGYRLEPSNGSGAWRRRGFINR